LVYTQVHPLNSTPKISCFTE